MTEPQEPLDVETVDEQPTVAYAMDVTKGHVAVAAAERLPDGTIRIDAQVRMRPSGRECWWRLYSTPTSCMREHQDHGVREVWAYRANPHVLVLDLVDRGRYELSVLAWRVNQTDSSRTGQTEVGEGKAQPPARPGPDSIDLLTEFPPALPGGARLWQQMTQPGQLRHPGDNRDNWQFYDYWQGGHGVRFEDEGSVMEAFKPKRGPRLPNQAGEAFKPLGYLAPEEDS